jgi:hypothetical protein
MIEDIEGKRKWSLSVLFSSGWKRAQEAMRRDIDVPPLKRDRVLPVSHEEIPTIWLRRVPFGAGDVLVTR